MKNKKKVKKELTQITSVLCRIFGTWGLRSKIKKYSTVSIRIRDDFWQHGPAQSNPSSGPNKPKHREWLIYIYIYIYMYT